MRSSKTSHLLWAAPLLIFASACGGGGYSGGGGGPPLADWYVSAVSGNDVGPGNAVYPFKTITHALTLAILGQSIYAFPGTYDAANGETFPMLVSAGVTLFGDETNQGNGPIPTRIVGGGVVPPPNVSGLLLGTLVPGQGATVAGFRIQDDVVPSGNFPYAIDLQNGSVTLRNDIVENSYGGIYSHNAAGSHVISGNAVRGHLYVGLIFVGGSGVGSRVEGNVFTGNTYGVEFDAPGGDLGGGAAGSVGGNSLTCNTGADLWTSAVTTIDAQNNLWDHVGPTVSTTTSSGGIDIYNGGGAAVLNLTGAALAPTPCP